VVWGLVIHIAVRGREQLMEHDEDHHAAHLVRVVRVRVRVRRRERVKVKGWGWGWG